MVTCNVNLSSKMSRRKPSSVSSGFRLLDGNQCDTVSSVSRNSVYKIKIDAMFDETKSVISHRNDDRSSLRDRRGTSSIHGGGSTTTSITGSRTALIDPSATRKDGRRISNSVQAQIERMFTDVAKDTTTCSFPVRCLGSMPLKDKVTSLSGLQDPLRQLYLSGAGHGMQNAGHMDISAKGLRIRIANGREPHLTPFHNIAVWSAVKFVVSAAEGGAAFLPLITDPDNIDKSSLFFPLSASDKRRLSSGLHSPLFAVVMRSQGIPKTLECHGFVCQTPEDAIVIAATLYQGLMAHMGNSQQPKTRRPRNRNGVSCISLASSSATNNLAMHQPAPLRKSVSQSSLLLPPRPPRKKRSASSSISGESDSNRDKLVESSTEERKKKSSKSKRAPPVPTGLKGNDHYKSSMAFHDEQSRARNNKYATHPPSDPYQTADVSGGDILTRVAIPRSGSFLNTGGLSRYKSRATRRHAGKIGGGGGSPLGFSELFNEFRLQENLHSLDEILNAIINSDGMSFNDLKPIYKEFLLKLAVTLTKDELYQRSKSIMRRQKKKKLRRRNSNVQVQRKKSIVGATGLKRVFKFGKFRSKKSTKTKANDSLEIKSTKSNSKTRTGTSGSDVSVIRNEHTLNRQNRNSSSGYVSCSECSYDSEACTCASADRCYCSMGQDLEMTTKLKKRGNRDSMISCPTDEKCYCSMEEAKSSTSWCDSDSCISQDKCYCKRGHKNRNYGSNNLALDYELFTVGGGGRQMKAHEALSVKKSVEMAAVFADVKLSQTTDIQSLAANIKKSSKRRDSKSSKKSNGTVNSTTSDLILRREKEMQSPRLTKSEEFYQPIGNGGTRPVSASLEDSLGYLP